jgi:hypothetical protein
MVILINKNMRERPRKIYRRHACTNMHAPHTVNLGNIHIDGLIFNRFNNGGEMLVGAPCKNNLG